MPTGIAIAIAAKNTELPVNPNSIAKVTPNRPASMPSGKPKFKPHPECTIGTIESTKMPFQANLLKTFDNNVDILFPETGAKQNITKIKPTMIHLEIPKLETNVLIFSFTLVPFLFNFIDH